VVQDEREDVPASRASSFSDHGSHDVFKLRALLTEEETSPVRPDSPVRGNQRFENADGRYQPYCPAHDALQHFRDLLDIVAKLSSEKRCADNSQCDPPHLHPDIELIFLLPLTGKQGGFHRHRFHIGSNLIAMKRRLQNPPTLAMKRLLPG
jgi:hypothetical protein